MPKYRYNALVTISLHAIIRADSERDAEKLVSELRMPSIYDGHDAPDVWHTIGELDGEAFDVELDEDTP